MLLALVTACLLSKTTDTADTAGGPDGTDTADTGADTADTAPDTAETGIDTADTGADTADTGGDSGTDAFCAERLSTEAPGNQCLEAEVLRCGDVVEATVAGGEATYGADSWEDWACTTNLDSHTYDGPERGWMLELPARTTATLLLETPCADLDLFAVYWQEDTCPSPATTLHVCEAGDRSGDTDTVRIVSVSAEQDLVFVDGKEREAANFRLTVNCDG